MKRLLPSTKLKESKDSGRRVRLSDRDFLMFAPTGSGKSLVFHIAPFENISLHK